MIRQKTSPKDTPAKEAKYRKRQKEAFDKLGLEGKELSDAKSKAKRSK